ncbi:MAG TPA: PAS domain S-box protein [Verrucomicrobiae bacterium]|nr:PAS domain S-box protein [Verrucomicrobiae bacterium]
MKTTADQDSGIKKVQGGHWWIYVAALVLPLVTLGGRLLLGERIGRMGEYPTLIIFTVPIILCAYWGGLFPGLLATLTSYLGASYFLLPPIYSFAITDTKERWQQVSVILAGGFISIICELSDRSRRRVEKAVTELQRKESELEAALDKQRLGEITANRLAAIVECSDDAIIGKDLNSVITSWNQGAEKIFGYPAGEMVGTSIMRLIPAERRDDENLILGKIKNGESLQHFETLRLTKDGRLIHVSVTASPIRDATGKIVGVSKVARDITARKRGEEALQEAQALYHSLVEQMPAGVFRKDAGGRYVFVNSAFCRLKGVTPEQYLGKTALELGLADKALADSGVSHHVQIMQAGGPIEAEEKHVCGDRALYFQALKSAVRDATGKITGSQGILFDITERKQAEAALGESEERFRTMANSITQLAWIARADGFIFWYNRRWFDYTGTTPAQMEGWGWQNVHDPAVLPKVMAGWTTAIGAGKPFEMEFPLRGADGKFRAFLTRAQPVKDPAGRVVQWCGTNTDVEDLKQVEEKIQQLNTELEQRVTERTAQLEAANKELEAFSYSVSHDLRAPLRGVDGYIQMLQEDCAGQLDAEGNRLLGVVSSEAKRMGRLIDDLLTFSRLGRAHMAKAEIDTTALARSVFENLTETGPVPRFELKPLPPTQGDLGMLRQVFVNLLSNAIKFTRHQPAPLIEVGSRNGEAVTVYFVKDNGVGFDEKYGHKLFGVFQRLHSEDEFEGTGVGLALVQRVIQRHGGKVWAEAKPNQGATFYFTLPITADNKGFRT